MSAVVQALHIFEQGGKGGEARLKLKHRARKYHVSTFRLMMAYGGLRILYSFYLGSALASEAVKNVDFLLLVMVMSSLMSMLMMIGCLCCLVMIFRHTERAYKYEVCTYMAD